MCACECAVDLIHAFDQVTDELFSEIATKVVNEDDSTIECKRMLVFGFFFPGYFLCKY